MTIRAEQIDAIVAAARRPCLPIVPCLHSPGYSYLSPEGTRVGTIRSTREEKAADWKRVEDRNAAEFRVELEKMGPDALARQVEYWLFAKPDPAPTVKPRRRR